MIKTVKDIFAQDIRILQQQQKITKSATIALGPPSFYVNFWNILTHLVMPP